ncbi:hypothetical protein PDJAM_G00218950 [Pangasius djambal]|uniref:Uncharacterized protein n=1 Tax=Pangasius djambal TaxID=1691987 RepID=A0ACC5YDM8_9TELE|nr:hypothetical protein [Pangasius djambal]
MNSEVYRAILSAQFHSNAAKLIGQRFTVQMDNNPKHTESSLRAWKLNVLKWPSQSPDLNPIELLFTY